MQRLGGFLLLLGAVLALTAVPAKAATLPTPAGELDFQVLREGTPIGRHRVVFSQDGDRQVVEIAIDLEVKFAFFTLFRYQHRNREAWQDGRLVSIDTQTDDDGTAHWVRGRATADGFLVESDGGTVLAPATVIPTSYWHPATVEQTRLLDTQRGRLLDVQVERVGADPAARAKEALRYRMTGDLELDLWYSAGGHWAKIAFQARGAEVRYRPWDQAEETRGEIQAAGKP